MLKSAYLSIIISIAWRVEREERCISRMMHLAVENFPWVAKTHIIKLQTVSSLPWQLHLKASNAGFHSSLNTQIAEHIKSLFAWKPDKWRPNACCDEWVTFLSNSRNFGRVGSSKLKLKLKLKGACDWECIETVWCNAWEEKTLLLALPITCKCNPLETLK